MAVRVVLVVFVLLLAVGCKKPTSGAGADPKATLADAAVEATSAVVDGGFAAAEPSPDGGADAATAPTITALGIITPIFSETEWPARDPDKASEARKGVVRLGYLRAGAKVTFKGSKIEKANCAEGWFELTAGGFVCGKYAKVEPTERELRYLPHPPYSDRPLPYDYGLNITSGAPLYRRRPLRRERKEYEAMLAKGRGKKDSDMAKQLRASGKAVPSYLKDSTTGIGFADLKGSAEGSTLIVQRMLRGFYLGINRRRGSMWITTQGYWAPTDHVVKHKATTEFEGVRLTDEKETRTLPLAFIIGTRARRYTISDNPDGGPKKLRRKATIDRFSIINITGKHEVVEGRSYYETKDEAWVRDFDVAIVRQNKPPPGLRPGEKWIDVDITSESLVAYEGDKPVYATIVSTGRHTEDPKTDHTTVTGSFRVREKHVTDTMDDDSGTEGAYKIEDVPWVMYFERSYALHGAFWHSKFGRERSHGCVNMTPHDARQIFAWAGPTIPAGWHGVKASDQNPGTLVVVHK